MEISNKYSATAESRQAVTWAAGTLKARGFQLHPADHSNGWDVESPEGNWFAAEDWRELCLIARSITTGTNTTGETKNV
jgi:hypothetical protein